MRLLERSLQAQFLFLLFLFFSVNAASAQEKPNVVGADAAQPAKNYSMAKKQPPAVAPGETAEELSSDKSAPPGDESELIRKREEWFYKQRASANGHIPAGARLKAFQHMQRMMEAEGKIVHGSNLPHVVTPTLSVSSPAWTPIGPAPTTGGFYTPTTGRVTTIAVDPADATGNTLLIGAAQGGIWRSTDAGAHWTALGDQNPSLAMGSIAFANPSSNGGAGVVYAGTGEQASIGFDVYFGAGVLKSADGGLHWVQTCTVPSATCPFIGPYSDFTFGFFSDGGAHISYVAVNPSNPNLVLVAAQTTQNTQSGPILTAGGVYCSDDGGTTWNSILSAAAEMATFVGFASSTTAYAALGRTSGTLAGAANPNGVYKSTNADGGATKKCGAITFSNVTANGVAGVPASSFGRIDLGIAAADASGQTAYASIADASIDPNTGRSRASRANLGVFKTTDGGTTWTNTNAPDVCNPQCWYDNVIKVDPAKSNVVYFGGGAHIAIISDTLVPSWLVRSTDGGITWNPALPSPLASGNPGLPHVDQHALAFVQAGSTMRLYLGNDGGVWRTDDAEATAVTWNNLNNSPLQITQFYPSLSIHPSTPSMGFGGTQDNGSQNFNGADTWTNNDTCGDGGWTVIDPAVPSTVYVLCQLISLRKSVNNGLPLSFRLARSGINITDPVNFIAPLAVDPVNTQNLYFGTSNIYQSVDGAQNWVVLSSASPFVSPGGVTVALAVGGGTASNIVYAAYSDGQLVAANLVGPGQANFSILGQGQLPPREPTQIVVDPSDSTGNTVYVTYSGFAAGTDQVGHIFKSVNAGGTWTDVSCTKVGNCSQPNVADLPNIPVNDLVIDPQAAGTLYAATDLGVFQGTCVALACTWTSFNNNSLPNVAVLSLRLHAPSRTLRAATHGRGVWDLILPGAAAFGITAISPISANVGDPGVSSLAVSGDGFTANSQVTFTVNGKTTTLATTFVSANQLNAMIPAASLQAQGVAQIAVTDTTQTAPTNSLPFPILLPAPTVSGINPASTPVQVNPVNSVPVVISGSNLAANATVILNPFYSGAGGQVKLTTTFGNGQITATIPANLLGPFGSTNDVQVSTSPPGGGVSPLTTFKVLAPAPPNDNFANALDLGVISSPDIQDTSAATTETNDPVPPCGQVITSPPSSIVFGNANSVWYKFTPTTNGNLSLSLSGTSFVSWLSVWTGSSHAALLPVPNACSGIPIASLVVQPQLANIALNGGTTYYVMVGSAGPTAGSGVVTIGLSFIPNPIAFGGKSVLTFSFVGSPDFKIASSGTTVAVTAGQTATFTNAITVSPLNGFNAQVTLSCAPPASLTTCSVNPNTFASGSGTASVSVSTMARGLAPPYLPPTGRFYLRPQLVPLFLLALLLAVLMLRFARTRRQRLAGALPFAVLALFLVLQATGCGGGGGGSGPPPPTGTPAGTYAVTVTGTSGNTTHTTMLTLTVN